MGARNPFEQGQVAATPRDRIEKAIEQRRKLNEQFNLISNQWADGRIKDYRQVRAQHGALEQQLENWRKAFAKLVSMEPEARAWVEVATDLHNLTQERFGKQVIYGTTPTDKSRAEGMIEVANSELMAANENLAKVLEVAPAR